MPKYLVQAAYTAEGLKGLMKDKASGRLKAVKKAVETAGGKVEGMYYSLGEYDALIICDMPDAVSGTAISLAASASGLVRTKTTALLSVEEMDQACSKSVAYTPPGG